MIANKVYTRDETRERNTSLPPITNLLTKRANTSQN